MTNLNLTPLRRHVTPAFVAVNQPAQHVLEVTSSTGMRFVLHGLLTVDPYATDASVHVYARDPDGADLGEVFSALASETWVTGFEPTIQWKNLSASVRDGITRYESLMRLNGVIP